MLAAKQWVRLYARGPKGEKRPTDVNKNAVLVAKIAIGEAADDAATPNQRARMPPPSPWGAWAERRGPRYWESGSEHRSLERLQNRAGDDFSLDHVHFFLHK